MKPTDVLFKTAKQLIGKKVHITIKTADIQPNGNALITFEEPEFHNIVMYVKTPLDNKSKNKSNNKSEKKDTLPVVPKSKLRKAHEGWQKEGCY